VEANMKADTAECFTMSLFDTSQCSESHCLAKNAGLSWENGGWSNQLRFYPGDFRKTVGHATEFKVGKISINSSGEVNFYWDGELQYTTYYTPINRGPLQFIGGCSAFEIKDLRISTAEPQT